MNLYCSPSPPPVNAAGMYASSVSVDNEEEDDSVIPELLFTENDTNFERLYSGKNPIPYVKDAFHDHIIPSHRSKLDGTPPHAFVNPNKTGSKSAAHYSFKSVPGRGGCVVVRLKLTPKRPAEDSTINDDESFDELMEERRSEADEFYHQLAGTGVGSDLVAIMRQALSGMMWYVDGPAPGSHVVY
jgi:hypothetical protein